MAIANLTNQLLATGAVLFLLHLIVRQLRSPLKSIPGPFFAKFTDLWRFVDNLRCTQVQSHEKLHEKLGPVVRIGPNMLSLNDPSLLKVVYSTRGDFVKSNFYEVADAVVQGQRAESPFSTRSNAFHSKYMQPCQKYFTMGSILEKEHLTDPILVSLCEQLEKRFMNGENADKTVDLAAWIEYGAWDLDWKVTFSDDIGFVRSGTDVEGMIHTGERIMRYLACIGQIPWLDRLLGKNPYCPIKFATFQYAADYSIQRVIERTSSQDVKSRGDFLDNFLEAKELYPDIVSNVEVMSYLMMNVLAGADTTAIVLKTIVYHILQHDSVHQKLLHELDAASLSFPTKYEDTKDLPYLNAVIKEGMRIHPVIGGIMERVVPPSGLTLVNGQFIPPGTKIGMNPWVTSRNKDVYGDDAESFRPERWLRFEDEAEDAYQSRLKKMKEADFTFGAGRRVCIGRHMATVEIYKTISTLFSRYDIKLDPSRKQWSTRWYWFTFVDDIHVKMRRRPDVSAAWLS